jgi:hypothetical protein
MDNKSSEDEKISSKKQIAQNQFQKKISLKKIDNPDEMNRLTRDIFKK